MHNQIGDSTLLLNPALAGMNTCDYRVYANFRAQWFTLSGGNTYRTFAGGGDMSIGKVTKYNSFAGIGLSFFSDQYMKMNKVLLFFLVSARSAPLRTLREIFLPGFNPFAIIQALSFAGSFQLHRSAL